MRGREARVVDLSAPLPPFVVSDLRQLPPCLDQRIGESCFLENPQRAWMYRESVAVLGRPLVHVNDPTRTPCCCRNRAATRPTGPAPTTIPRDRSD